MRLTVHDIRELKIDLEDMLPLARDVEWEYGKGGEITKLVVTSYTEDLGRRWAKRIGEEVCLSMSFSIHGCLGGCKTYVTQGKKFVIKNVIVGSDKEERSMKEKIVLVAV